MLPVLIDTDMGVDDAFAICLLASCPQVRIVAAGAVGGNVPVAQAAENLAGVFQHLGISDVPLAKGSDQPDPDVPRAADLHGDNGLGGVQLPKADVKFQDAVELMASTIQAHPGELNILALGPLTNLAALAAQHPQLLLNVQRIFIMGGAVFHPGNVTRHAEFNFYRDPQAAADVLAVAGSKTTLAPLDLTNRVSIDEFHLSHFARANNPASQLLGQILQFPLRQPDAGASADSAHIHDVVAAAGMIWPERFLHTMVRLDIATSGAERGRSKPMQAGKAEGPPTKILIGVDGPTLLEQILLQITHEPFV